MNTDVIKIGNVVLNQKAINRLESLQEDDNSEINYHVIILQKTICFLLLKLAEFDFQKEEQVECNDYMQAMAYLITYLNDLKAKP